MSYLLPFNFDEAVRNILKDFAPGRRVNALVRIVYDDTHPARIGGEIIMAELVTVDGSTNIRVKLKGDDGETYERLAFSGFYSNILVVNESGDGYV